MRTSISSGRVESGPAVAEELDAEVAALLDVDVVAPLERTMVEQNIDIAKPPARVDAGVLEQCERLVEEGQFAVEVAAGEIAHLIALDCAAAAMVTQSTKLRSTPRDARPLRLADLESASSRRRRGEENREARLEHGRVTSAGRPRWKGATQGRRRPSRLPARLPS